MASDTDEAVKAETFHVQPGRLARPTGTPSGPGVEYLEPAPSAPGREAWLLGGGDNAEVVYTRPHRWDARKPVAARGPARRQSRRGGPPREGDDHAVPAVPHRPRHRRRLPGRRGHLLPPRGCFVLFAVIYTALDRPAR